LNSGPGTITINNVNVDAEFPNISLLTMIAPSPDWMAMIGNQKLTDASDNWLTSIEIDVYAVDTGTDSGTTSLSGDIDTNPRQDISCLENISPFSNQIIGAFVFTLEQVLSVRNDQLEKTISVYPNPSNGKPLKVYKNITNQRNIELNSFAKGLYFLRLNSDKGTITKKFIIQ